MAIPWLQGQPPLEARGISIADGPSSPAVARRSETLCAILSEVGLVERFESAITAPHAVGVKHGCTPESIAEVPNLINVGQELTRGLLSRLNSSHAC